ncbi:MAG: Ig-like domain-containing protein [Gemmatimonadales bacterium]
MSTRTSRLRGPFSLALAASILLSPIAGCGGEDITPPHVVPVPTAIVLSASTLSLVSLGATQHVTATVRDQTGGTMAIQVSWASTNDAVATVSATGTVTAIGNGTTTITASAGAVTATVAVTVDQEPAAISLSSSSVRLGMPGAETLHATVTDARGAPIVNAAVTWSTSEPAIATVTQSGVVSSVSSGSTTVTAAAGSVTATASVIVSLVAAITVTAPVSEAIEGQPVQLTVGVTTHTGAPVTGVPVTWLSDSVHIATVDASGRLTGLRAGVTRIRARADGLEASLLLTVRGLVHRWTFSESGGSGTVFLDDLGGAHATIAGTGSSPASAVAGMVTLTGGPQAQAQYVALPAGLLRTKTDATIEIWATLHSLKAWSRVFDIGSSAANNLFIAWSHGTDPTTDRTGFTVNGVEQRLDRAFAPFTIDLQHHIVLAIDEGGGAGGQTRLTLYLDGTPRGSFETTYRLRDLVDTDFWLGRSHYLDETANASYDEVRIHDRAFAGPDVQQSFLRGPVRSGGPVSISILPPAGMRDTVRGVDVRFALKAIGKDQLGRQFPVAGAQWSSSNPNVASINPTTGAVHAKVPGATQVTLTVGSTVAHWSSEVVRLRRVAVDPYLATPATGALWEVPVVIIEYLPTADGSNIDVTRNPDFWWLNPMSLDAMEANNLAILKRRKMMVEQGSRFRGYANAAALPSLGYRVVDHIIVYDQIPPHPTKRSTLPGQPRYEDWHAVMADLNLAPFMTAHTVRELWVAWSGFDGGFPIYMHDPTVFKVEDMRVGWESNMVSPTTADISNSDRDPHDAPKLSHTYIIYGVPTRRSQAEAVHVVGHQLEAMLSYISSRQTGNDRFFWEKFVGVNALNQFATGRAGWTHMPPNTTGNYDYINPTLVASDIEDWRPDNAGQQKAVNVDTWGNLTYPWPGEPDFGQRVESQWYTYWFQNFPGRGNQIPHGPTWMTNWWSFVANWDAAITSGLGLYASTPAAVQGANVAYPYQAPATTRAPVVHRPGPP